ncbi:efflux RND transporter periplasmic adaptor subunit [Pseudomaricurvus alcaniphilus]|uniref:efflux RND transporter periplasmic adaptor subunit n=1 Tax=Pseudomaricurvus alcaniphilus TaxID=1166482 RepID=UPI001FB75D47|nr:efflux RND transporter periplasmic adaptor subunit [Pseudomaricurvus alcaniphilus]
MQAKSRKRILPIVILGVVIIIVAALILSEPKPEKRNANTDPKISVEAIEIQRSSITPRVLSYGLVEPRTRSKLVAQVSGRVEHVSERFRDGGFFRKGELLLQIDATDYEIAVDIAQASLAEAEQRLAEEYAQAEQARADWERLGNNTTAKPLVMREPQLKAAQANVSSAKALLRKAKVDLARTSIRAPFDGRVLSTSVDLGQVASNNTVLGEIYATDAVEIRLPIKNNDLQLLDLPEAYRHQEHSPASMPSVRIGSELARQEVWQGNIIRTASSIDDSSRQLYVVARIDDPFGKKAEGRFPLKIGQYVTAEIDGITLDSAISIPNKAIYQGSYVYLYREGAVYRTPIDISWQNGEVAIISAGISPGDQLVVSPLGQVASGTLVKLTRDEGQTAAGKVNRKTAEDYDAGRDGVADQGKGKKGAAI